MLSLHSLLGCALIVIMIYFTKHFKKKMFYNSISLFCSSIISSILILKINKKSTLIWLWLFSLINPLEISQIRITSCATSVRYHIIQYRWAIYYVASVKIQAEDPTLTRIPHCAWLHGWSAESCTVRYPGIILVVRIRAEDPI